MDILYWIAVIVLWFLKWYLIGVLVAIPIIKITNKYDDAKLPWVLIFASWVIPMFGLVYFFTEVVPNYRDNLFDRLAEKIIKKWQVFSQSNLNKKISKWFNN